MTDSSAILALAKKHVQYPLPPTDNLEKRSAIVYAGTAAGDLHLDLYRPARANGPLPVVVHVNGYPFPAALQSQWQPMISWARLLQGQGIASVIYETVEPVQDGLRLLDFLVAHGADLGLDSSRIGLLASSGHGPNALGLLVARPGRVRCAVLRYPFLLDGDGATTVADAARDYGFANPVAGAGIGDLPVDVPVLLARAGRDHFAGLTASLDRFAARALAMNLPLTVINHPTGGHAFDLEDDSPASRRVIGQEVAFWREQLNAGE